MNAIVAAAHPLAGVNFSAADAATGRPLRQTRDGPNNILIFAGT